MTDEERDALKPAPDPRLLCPLHKCPCWETKCAWWLRVPRTPAMCAILQIATTFDMERR
jgi:hypothetical protein